MQADELLIEISEKNSQKAFKLLFESYYPSLCIFGRRYIESEEVVEDVVQDVFTSLWENRHRINIETSAKNYLITMTRNFCLNYLQRNRIESKYIQGKMTNPFEIGSNDLEGSGSFLRTKIFDDRNPENTAF